MLKYFKRQKSQRSVENDTDVAANKEKRHSLLSTSSFCDEFLLAEEDSQSLKSVEEAIGDEDIFNYHSRLSMSLASILKDTECMTCFVQYSETKNCLPIIKFYLDTENFKISAIEQLENPSAHCTSQSKNETFHNNNNNNENNNNNNNYQDEGEDIVGSDEKAKANNVPELKTLYDLSMHKPLTDDEKSQIYAETNKQIKCSDSNTATTTTTTVTHKLKACSEQSLYSELSQEDDATTSVSYDTPPPNSHSICVSEVSIKDAIAIYQKYLSPNAKFFVELPVNVLSDISLLLCKRRHQDEINIDDETTTITISPISPDCFDDAQQYVLNKLEQLYLNDFLQSTFYCKYCLDLICDDKLTINDILYSEVTLFFFMEFLEQHGERECLDFWTAAINFRKSYANIINCEATTTTDAKESLQDDAIIIDAMIIYKKFFSLQSDARLWLSDKLRCRVEESICARKAEKIANCFDLALIVTAKYLERKYFEQFLKSDIFAQYINELRGKTQNGGYDYFENCIDIDSVDAGELPAVSAAASLQHKLSFKGQRKLASSKPNSERRQQQQHRKTLSDCTNDCTSARNCELSKHISQHNTLLAMDTSSMHWKNFQTSGTSMSIDSRQLTNPNLLWHRKYSSSNNESSKESNGRLKFGHVTALGRYERDFETVEAFNSQASSKNHHWSLGVSGNKIKNAMRKLVNLPEDKAQEEIAWQIAEMIVKDVTNVTMKNIPLDKSESTAIVPEI